MAHATFRWLLLLALLAPAAALAQDDEATDADEAGEADEAPAPDEAPVPDEAPAPGDDEEAGTPELIPEARPLWDDGAVADPAPEPEPAPVPVVEPAPEPAETEPEPAEPPPARIAERPMAPAYLGVAFSLGGARLAMLDEGWQELTSQEQLETFHWALDVSLLPRLAISVGGAATTRHSIGAAGGDSYLELRPRISSLDVSARFIPSPPSFPVRAFVRAGGGFLRVHVEAVDTATGGNLRQRDHRGAAPYALLGGGVEVISPHRVRGKVLPMAGGFSAEAGARLGGGGVVTAAPSVALDDLGSLDVGPWYFQFSFVGSVVLTPRKYASLVPSITGR